MFRVIDILAALTGFYFLFRLVYEKTSNFFLAIFPGAFMLSSPVFAYYAGNYLPDTFSTSIVFIGFYFLFKYLESKGTKALVLCLAMFTLAGLVKTTSVIFLLAAAGILLLYSLFKPRLLTLKQKWILFAGSALGLGLIASYTVYNKYLNNKHQAWLFLADIKPIKDKEMLEYIKLRFFEVWQFEYFSRLQYVLIGLGGAFFILVLITQLKKRLPQIAMALISLLGALCFFVLMGEQLIDHDYYIISAFYPVLMLFLLLVTLWFGEHIRNKYVVSILAAVICIGLLKSGYKHHEYRLQDNYKGFSDSYSYKWMLNGAETINNANVEKDARLLVLSTVAPNLALSHFDRNGLVWRFLEKDKPNCQTIKIKLQELGLQYALIQKDDYDQLVADDPGLQNQFVSVVKTEQFLVLKPLPALSN